MMKSIHTQNFLIVTRIDFNELLHTYNEFLGSYYCHAKYLYLNFYLWENDQNYKLSLYNAYDIYA